MTRIKGTDIVVKKMLRQDYDEFYPDIKAFIVEGISFFRGSELVAIAGVHRMNDIRFLFSEIKEDVEKNPVTVVRCAKYVMDYFKKISYDLYAVPTPSIDNNHKFLTALGFRRYGGFYLRDNL